MDNPFNKNTDLKKTQKKLELSETKFYTVAQTATDSIIITDQESIILFINKRGEATFGYKENELAGKNLSILMPEKYREGHNKGVSRFVKTGVPKLIGHTIEIEGLRKDGTVFPIELSLSSWEDEGKHYFSAINRDITERKQEATNTLSESEERFETIANEAPAFIFIASENGQVEFVNKTWLEFTGISADKAKGLAWAEVTHPEDMELISKVYNDAITRRRPYTFEVRHQGIDGNYRWVLWKGLPRFLKTGNFIGMMGIGVDITDRKKAEEALIESEERFRAMADNIPNLAWMANADGWIFWYNKTWYEYTGTTPKEMEGWGWKSVHDLNELPKVMSRWSRSIETGEPFEMTFPLKAATGEFKPFLTRVIPVKDDQGNIIKWFGTNTDVYDQERLINQLKRTNNDLDNFIYTASHDLKAPVSNIEGLISSLKDTLQEEYGSLKTDTDVLLDLINKSIIRFKSTIADLTEISKVQKQEEELEDKINLMEIVEEVKSYIMDDIVKSEASIKLNVTDSNYLNFSRKNLKSVFYNLLSNAIKYRDPSRTPVICIESKTRDGYLILTFEDNGLGIPVEQHEKLFTMFKRFHTHVDGSGIGLYIVKRIIDNSGGKIEVESEVGKGTVFKVYIKKTTNV